MGGVKVARHALLPLCSSVAEGADTFEMSGEPVFRLRHVAFARATAEFDGGAGVGFVLSAEFFEGAAVGVGDSADRDWSKRIRASASSFSLAKADAALASAAARWRRLRDVSADENISLDDATASASDSVKDS